MTDKKIAICAKCKSVLKDEESDGIWSYCCKKYPNKKAINPITGKDAFIVLQGKDDFPYTEKPYDQCMSHNKLGDCKNFE